MPDYDLVVLGSGPAGENGPATAASLLSPIGIAIDGGGNLYFSDTVRNRILRVDAATKILTRFAGSDTQGFSGDGGPATAANMFGPDGLAIDAAGNVYVAESNNHRVRRIDAATKVITTIAGNGAGSFAGDGGLATSASLSSPGAIALDRNGTLYIADSGTNRIRILTTIDVHRHAARH